MLEHTSKIRERIEYLVIFGTAGISLLIAVIDLTGLLDASSWVAQRIPSLTLLAVGFVASYLIWERRGKIDAMARDLDESSEAVLEEIARSATRVITALDGVEIINFASSASLNRYVTKRLRKAQYVDDTSWGKKAPKTRSRQATEMYSEYQNSISSFAKNSKTIWREVAIFHTLAHLEREKQRILEESSVAYNLGCYEVPTANAPNLRGFMIIDQSELIVNHDQQGIWLCIKHPTIVKYFSAYFEDIWQASKKLKQGDFVDYQELERIEVQLKQYENKSGLTTA